MAVAREIDRILVLAGFPARLRRALSAKQGRAFDVARLPGRGAALDVAALLGRGVRLSGAAIVGLAAWLLLLRLAEFVLL